MCGSQAHKYLFLLRIRIYKKAIIFPFCIRLHECSVEQSICDIKGMYQHIVHHDDRLRKIHVVT